MGNYLFNRNIMENVAKMGAAQVACSVINNLAFTTVFGLYYFGAIGATDLDCYYVKGSQNPMTRSIAVKYARGDEKPVNVSEKFDLVLSLGFWQFSLMWLIIIAGGAVMVLGVWNFILIFMTRGTESGAVCAGSYLKGNEASTAPFNKIVMVSKGRFLLFLLICNWIAVGCCACGCLSGCIMIIKAKMS